MNLEMKFGCICISHKERVVVIRVSKIRYFFIGARTDNFNVCVQGSEQGHAEDQTFTATDSKRIWLDYILKDYNFFLLPKNY